MNEIKVSQIIEKLEQFAPLSLQESFDNSGLQVGDSSQTVKGVLLCVDVTEAIVNEAIERGANLIISHHPLLFRGLKHITGQTYIERVVMLAIANNIAIYSTHTCMDKCVGGINFRFAKILGLKDIRVLSPDAGNDTVGLGCVGELENPMTENEFIELLKEKFSLKIVKHSALLGKYIKKIAVCGGSGAEFIPDAIKSGADIYVTADIKYHDFFLAEKQIVIADIGHFESECCIKDILKEQLIENFSNFAILTAYSDINPVSYS